MKVWWFMVIEIHANKNAVRATNGWQWISPLDEEKFLNLRIQKMLTGSKRMGELVTPFAVQQTDVHFR